MWILKVLGSGCYSMIAGYLLWLMWHFAIPQILSTGWLWFFVIFILGSGLVYGVLIAVNSILSIPTIWLTKDNMVAKIIMAIPYLFYGYDSLVVLWHPGLEFSVLQWVQAILFTFTIAISYWNMIAVPFKEFEKT